MAPVLYVFVVLLECMFRCSAAVLFRRRCKCSAAAQSGNPNPHLLKKGFILSPSPQVKFIWQGCRGHPDCYHRPPSHSHPLSLIPFYIRGGEQLGPFWVPPYYFKAFWVHSDQLPKQLWVLSPPHGQMNKAAVPNGVRSLHTKNLIKNSSMSEKGGL